MCWIAIGVSVLAIIVAWGLFGLIDTRLRVLESRGWTVR